MQRAEKILIVLLIICATLTVALIGILVAYNFLRTMQIPGEMAAAELVLEEAYYYPESAQIYEEASEALALPGAALGLSPVVTPLPPWEADAQDDKSFEHESLVTSSTAVIFERTYLSEGIVERSEERLPHFAINMDRQSLAQLYSDWDIVEFSPALVVMRRYISDGPHFIISEMDGFVAAFRQNSGSPPQLWSLTRTPLVALPLDEQQRIREGIIINSEDALMRILQDFDS